METYLLKLPVSFRIPSTKFRVSNHKLPIEIGRYENVERSEGKCIVCHVLGDEFHFLFQCIVLMMRGSYFCQNSIGLI